MIAADADRMPFWNILYNNKEIVSVINLMDGLGGYIHSLRNVFFKNILDCPSQAVIIASLFF